MGFSALAFINNIVLVSLISIPTCGGEKKKNFQHLIMQQPQMIMVNGQAIYVVSQPPPGMMMQHQQPAMQSPYQLQLQPQLLPTANFNYPNQPINNMTVHSSSVAMMPKDSNPGSQTNDVIKPTMSQNQSEVSTIVEINDAGHTKSIEESS